MLFFGYLPGVSSSPSNILASSQEQNGNTHLSRQEVTAAILTTGFDVRLSVMFQDQHAFDFSVSHALSVEVMSFR